MNSTNLPDGWVKAKLGDYLYLKNGFAFKKDDYVEKSENSFPIIRISDIDGRKATDESAIHTSKPATGFELQKGDLLLAMSGATTGKMGVYVGKLPAYQNQRVGNLKLKGEGDEVFRNFLMLSLQEKIEKLAYGGAQPNISGKLIEDLDIVLPPIPEQQKIAQKLTALLDNVAQIKTRLETIPNLLKTFRQSVLARAVSGELSAKWREENGVGLESWEAVKISDVSTKCKQRKPDDNESFIYVDISAINREKKTIESPQHLLGKDAPSRARKVIHQGDVLVSLTRPNLNAVAIVGEEFDNQIASTGFEVIHLEENIDPYFIFSLVKTLDFIETISSFEQGALYPAAKSSDVQNYQFKLPTFEEQAYITQAVKSYLNFADQIETQVQQALERVNLMTQAILAKGFRGELC